jgi:hypothetical protein
MFDRGFLDATSGQVPHPFFKKDPEYMDGYQAGRRYAAEIQEPSRDDLGYESELDRKENWSWL